MKHGKGSKGAKGVRHLTALPWGTQRVRALPKLAKGDEVEAVYGYMMQLKEWHLGRVEKVYKASVSRGVRFDVRMSAGEYAGELEMGIDRCYVRTKDAVARRAQAPAIPQEELDGIWPPLKGFG